MNVDTAIQKMLFKTPSNEIEDIAWCAKNYRTETVKRYKSNYGWSIEDCNEFLDNAVLAFELLIKHRVA